MKTTLLLAILISTSAFSSDMIRVFDGANAYCKTKFDSIKSKRANIYTLTNPRMLQTNDGVVITADIKFYDCNLNDGKYSFTQIANHMNAQYKFPNVVTGEDTTVYRVDLEKNLVAYSTSFKEVGASEIKGADLATFTLLEVKLKDLDKNFFPNAQDKGEFFTTLFLKTKTKTYTDTIKLGSRVMAHGSFRLFIDLENNKVSF